MPDSEHNQDSQKGPKILITIEGWGVNLVGAYGNALVPTPHLDQLASRSTLFDQFWVHSTQKHSVLRSISKAMDPDNWLLVTDDPIAAQIAVQCRPQLDVLEVSKAEGNDAFDWLVTQALELWIQNKYESQNLWIHSLGLAGEWDAPYEHRKVMCTSDDPDPPVDIVPPDHILGPDDDPDVLFGWSCGAGGQAICIDQGVGLLLQTLEELGLMEQSSLSIAGISGFPLGEHRRVGLSLRNETASSQRTTEFGNAYAERLHCPWLLKNGMGTAEPLGNRYSKPVQTAHLLTWIQSEVPYSEFEQRYDQNDSPDSGVAISEGVHEICVVTEHWTARWDTEKKSDGSFQISSECLGDVFCAPEDRWQQNEVANRVPEIESHLRRIGQAFLDTLGNWDPSSKSEVQSALEYIRTSER